jgi:hypothetical protein
MLPLPAFLFLSCHPPADRLLMDLQQHSYSTRIRHNIIIKPRRDDHSTIVPPDSFPLFPPTNVVLHPDDASSKVFLAMARAFVAVVCIFFFSSFSFSYLSLSKKDNRAMTIKDIAERAGRYGLVCQKYVCLSILSFDLDNRFNLSYV